MGTLDIIEYVVASSIVLVPIGTVFFLAWRLVRALERRKGANVRVLELVQQVRALRTEVTMLSGELSELDAARDVPPGRTPFDRPPHGSAS